MTALAEQTIRSAIARLNNLISCQLNEIIHHSSFQKLEATWRGLYYLVHQIETGENLKIRVLNVKKQELLEDQDQAADVHQTALFQAIYAAEIEQLGGVPYSMLVGDYEFGRSAADIRMLQRISEIAATAHAPFVANTAPDMFGVESFEELPNPRELAKIFESDVYTAWKSFRDLEDSRYVVLTLPRVMARLPYGSGFGKSEELNFQEDTDGTDHSRYTWMGAAWTYAVVVTDAFARHGWMVRTWGLEGLRSDHGVLVETCGVEGGGKVEGLPVHTFRTDDSNFAVKCPTEVAIHDSQDFQLSKLGFLPLLYSNSYDFAVFMAANSCYKPKVYFDQEANKIAQAAAQVNLLLSRARFVHYLMVLTRDKVGCFMDLGEMQDWLNAWIRQYTLPVSRECDELEGYRYPLSDALIEIQPSQRKPGRLEMVAYLTARLHCSTQSYPVRFVALIPSFKFSEE